MRRMLGAWGVLAVVLMLTAAWATVQIWTNGNQTRVAAANELDTASAAAVRVPIRRGLTRRASETLSIAEAIRMTPEDWRNYLTSHAPELDPELGEELLELAVELEEAIAAGLSPQSVEAQVYGETMLVLLEPEIPDE